MQTSSLTFCFVWHAHQPFFIPDDEIRWRVDASYIPLIDAFTSRKLPLALSITSGTLERIEHLRPDFIDELRNHINCGSITLLGSLAHHPILPRLTTEFAKLHIDQDLTKKKELGLKTASILWPTELAFNLRCAALSTEYGYRAAILDSSSRDLSDTTPTWIQTSNGLSPTLPSAPTARPDTVAELFDIGTNRASFKMMFRERSLTEALSQASQDIGGYENAFMAAARRLVPSRASESRTLLFAEDIERVFPTNYQEFLCILDCLLTETHAVHDITTVFDAPASEYSYLPGTTMEVTERMWFAAADDTWFANYLLELCERARETFDILNPESDLEKNIVKGLLESQDSGFHVWHFVSRSRRPFFDKLSQIEHMLGKL